MKIDEFTRHVGCNVVAECDHSRNIARLYLSITMTVRVSCWRSEPVSLSRAYG